eukprot:346624-Pleurochrysis_carterae.AAC.1
MNRRAFWKPSTSRLSSALKGVAMIGKTPRKKDAGRSELDSEEEWRTARRVADGWTKFRAQKSMRAAP